MRRGSAGAAGAAFAAMVAAGAARASSGLDSPDIGVLQLGRGGAWVARADDPLAAYFNPAGLAAQRSGAHGGVHFIQLAQCFTRLGPGGRPVPPSATTAIPAPGSDGGPDPEVCAEGGLFPNPQLAATLRLSDALALGVAVLGPHGVGERAWPESLRYTHPSFGDMTQPSPQRYLLTSLDALMLMPTLSVGFTPAEGISLGAGFIWGTAAIDFVNFSEALSGEGGDDFKAHGDLRTRAEATDLFIPGFVLGARWAAAAHLDLGAWFKWQDAVRAKTDLTIESRYWTPAGAKDEDPCKSEAPKCNVTEEQNAGDLTMRIPMEAKLGLRYHRPRAGARSAASARRASAAEPRVRDPMADDVFDVELDFTWANNSAVDAIVVRFREGIPVRGTSVGTVPPNADVPHRWRDVLGVRLGGDYVVLPSLLALRAGGFFENKGQDDADLNLDFHLGYRIGVGAGVTARVGPVDISAAFQHTSFGALDNGGNGRLKAVSGAALSGYRSIQSVNGGRFESSLDEFGLSGTMRF
ncbi:OmpP1/FadL family transporter [Sorangium sp. So ce693]|uniref:OmpP1/FadL family transporter n=1 Tax=Sorangium sp. So ce693 TaxID=3133318 RepID=UPI003F5F588B